jgi:hypothetical protein
MAFKPMMLINISGLDKVKLLHELWNRQIVASYFAINGATPPAFDEEAAIDAVKKPIDYFSGRLIKADLSQDNVNPGQYDRDAGEGRFARIVSDLR